MAKATLEVIAALRNTASALEASNKYQWGHMGSCNCGFLVQEVTKLTNEEIHSRAMQKNGDWSEQLLDYCPTSGLPMDDVIAELLAFGFDSSDLVHLERLSDPEVLSSIAGDARRLQHNIKADVMLYVKSWAVLLEERLLAEISLPSVNSVTMAHLFTPSLADPVF